MKIKEGFCLREVAGSYIVVPIGKAKKDFNGMINLNETGAFLWKQLENDIDEEKLIFSLMDEYNIDRDKAEHGVKKFLDVLLKEELVKKQDK